jgi:hypothetical protein
MATRDMSDAIKIANKIIRVQGNVFIKDLLRKKKRIEARIRIGNTKEDILENLVEAIKAGYIVRADLEAWTQEVEGWGKQHVYLYRVAKNLAAEEFWRSSAAFQKELKQHSALNLGESEAPDLEFPTELKISSLSFTDRVFEVIWRRRLERWDRDETYDEKRTIDGDKYELRAYRQRMSRAVTRFVLKPDERVAALFLQVSLKDPTHEIARGMVKDTLSDLFGWKSLEAVNLSEPIKSIDQEELNSARAGDDSEIVAQSTKFAAEGASVAFEADPGNTRWKSIDAVRRVRGALKEKEFSGDSATFQIRLRAEEGMGRDVLMSLHAKQKRIYLHAQMTSKEVWYALNAIFGHAQ